MAQPVSSKEANSILIDPFNEPEPSAETGLNAHFGSTMAGTNLNSSSSSPGRSNLASNNPYSKIQNRADPATTTPPRNKANVETHQRNVSTSSRHSNHGSPRASAEGFPAYRAEAFGDFKSSPQHRRSGSRSSRNGTPPTYDEVIGTGGARARRTSSLTARFPGDKSHEPLNIIRRESVKADRSPHLKKRHLPGPDTIDRLDQAPSRVYHHDGPFDAALLARNSSFESAPISALEESNREALKATPAERVQDSIDKHVPLDGVAAVPPGVPDRLGRVYDYEEGTDMVREGTSDAGYKRWADKEYDPDDLKGKGEPGFSLDRALRAHTIDDKGGIEMQDRAGSKHDYRKAEQKGLLDSRDPVEIAGGEDKYADLQRSNDNDLDRSSMPRRSGSLRQGVEGLKKRVGNVVHRRHESKDSS